MAFTGIMGTKQLLWDVDEVLRTTPPTETRHHPESDNQAWLGRAANVIQHWDASRSAEFRDLVKAFHVPMEREAREAFGQILLMLNQAKFDLKAQARASDAEDYRRKLSAQDKIILEASGREIPLGVSHTLIGLFKEVAQAFPELNLGPFRANGQGDVLRSQISVAVESLSSLAARTGQRQNVAAGEQALANSIAIRSEPVAVSADRRKVFVVHGRNLAARDAMFEFLRAINLSPVEWSEAVSFTGEGTPHIGTILDKAFSEAKAVVVLITGDDVARLGTRFQTPDEDISERVPTPQARPNVLFEAGMAFGRQPTGTILVSLGKSRPFSDVAGRNEIRITNQPKDRQALADRLKTAGCDVQTEHQGDWYKAGDFDAAAYAPDSVAALGETPARATAPKPNVLKYQDIRNEGWFSTRIGTFSFQVMEFLNAQRDIPHPANNVSASMEFHHADGERFFVERALWLAVAKHVEFPNHVIIESGRTGKLCLAAQDQDSNCFVVTDLEFQSKLKRLKFGRWNIAIHITFDNGHPYIGRGSLWVEKDEADRTYLRYEQPAFTFA